MLFDPKFYEYSALCMVAKTFGKPLKINFRVPDFSIPISKRIEFDGYFERDNIAVEVKSYPLEDKDVQEIEEKYKLFNISKLLIVAPGLKNAIKHRNTQFIPFQPTIDHIANGVYQNLRMDLPTHLNSELLTGKHNFRYRLAKRSIQKRSRYLNQIDKKINEVEKLRTEITQRIPLSNPPIKVLWSTKRWISPKDHFYKNRNNLFLGGPTVFDVDGPQVHGAFKCCEISGKHNLCDMCIFFSIRETKKLVNILDWAGFRNIEVFFSGRSGFHIYVFDSNNNNLDKASKKFMEKKVKIDKQVTYSTKSEIAFPLTINGLTGYQLEYVEKIETFEPKNHE